MRIRTIKPEFFTHEGLYELEKETGLPIRVAFAGLWCVADKAGRFKWEPRRIGVAILPYDGIDFSRVLDALFTRGFIVRYRVKDACSDASEGANSGEYGAIPSFSKHQFLNNREKDSDLPEPCAAKEPDATMTREARVEDASGTRAIWKGRIKEGIGLACSPLFDLDGFNDEWMAFVAHRKKLKKPLTERAIELTIRKLESRPPSAIAALQMAMEKGWQSIEWEWFDRVVGNNGTPPPKTASGKVVLSYDAPRGNL